MFCPKCGAQNPDTAKFCAKCGTPFKKIDNSAVNNQNDYLIGQSVSNGNSAYGQNNTFSGNQQPVNPSEFQNRNVNVQAPPRPPKPPMTPKQKKKTIIISTLSGIAAICLIVFLVIFISGQDVRDFKKALNSFDTATVTTLYSKGSVKEQVKYRDCMKNFLEGYYTDLKDFTFADGSTSASMPTQYKAFQEKNGYSMYNCIYKLSEAGGIQLVVSGSLEDYLSKIDDLDDSKESYISAVGYAEKAKTDDDYYIDSISALAGVIEDDALYEKAQSLIKTNTDGYLNNIIEKADEYIAEEDFSAAKNLLEKAEKKLPDNAAVTAKIAEAVSAAGAKYAQKAAENFAAGDVSAAVGNMEAAISIDPSNTTYQAKLDEYNLYLPLNMCSKDNILSVTSDYRTSVVKSATSVNKKEYIDCLQSRYYMDSNPSTVTYIFEGKYDTVSGVLFSPIVNASMNRTGTAYFEVYGDGKLLYTSAKIQADSLPIDFSFSVTGIQKLEIKFIGSGSSVWGADAYRYGDYIDIANMTANKTIPEQ